MVTFTGVDSQTDMKKMSSLSERYPSVEFGVLVGSDTGMFENGIFPSLTVVEQLKLLGIEESMNTAIHLCGRYARSVMLPEGPPESLYGLCSGFGRVQVNLHGGTLSTAVESTLPLPRW